MSLGALFRLYLDGDRDGGSPRIHGEASEFVGLVTLDCARMGEKGLAAIDRIARARLEAHRCGCDLEVRNPGEELVGLIGFLGLRRCLGVEVQRKPK